MSEEWRNELVTKGTAYDALANLDQYAELGECLDAIVALREGDRMPKKIIYADDVIDAFRNHVRGGYIILPYEYIKDIVLSLPSAQPQRMKGKWLRNESDLSWWFECSKCGESPLYNPYADEMLTSFCPWCGAEMEVE